MNIKKNYVVSCLYRDGDIFVASRKDCYGYKEKDEAVLRYARDCDYYTIKIYVSVTDSRGYTNYILLKEIRRTEVKRNASRKKDLQS